MYLISFFIYIFSEYVATFEMKKINAKPQAQYVVK